MKPISIIFIVFIFYFCSPYLSNISGQIRFTYKLNISSENHDTDITANINCAILQDDIVKKETSLTSKLPQVISLDYDVFPNEKSSYYDRYNTLYNYEIEIPGHYYYKGVLGNSYYDNSVVINETTREKKIVLAKYIYKLNISDIDGIPIKNAKIDYQLNRNSKIVKQNTVLTNENGSFSDYIYDDIDKEPSRLYPDYSFEYKINSVGYYGKSDLINFSKSMNNIFTIDINLIKPIDYLNNNFLLSKKGLSLKKNILKFIDIILLQSLLSESNLELHSINLITFKEKYYMSFIFNNTNSYNSLKLNKYDIGKLLFDEVIRKILNPLNDYLGSSKEFYGYDLTVFGHTKNFVDEYATDKKIVFRFMLPNDIVKRYKNKDISGQQVLDASVILMDDERIELKLQ